MGTGKSFCSMTFFSACPGIYDWIPVLPSFSLTGCRQIICLAGQMDWGNSWFYDIRPSL